MALDHDDTVASACPCNHYTDIPSIRQALDSAESTQRLIAWLSGRTGHCGGNTACPRRGKTSLMVLNAIRDSCRPFLEQIGANKPSPALSLAVESQNAQAKSYEESFPALNSAAPSKKKPKRRIRPAIVPVEAGVKASAGNLVNVPTSTVWGEVAPTVSSTPVKAASTLMTPVKINPTMITPVKSSTVEKSLFTTPPMTSCKARAAEKDHDIDELPELQHLVQLHYALIRNCLVPSTALELHLLIRLLHAEPAPTPGELLAEGLSDILSTPVRCHRFARHVLARLSFVWRSMHVALLRDLVRCAPFRSHFPQLTNELEELASSRTVPSLRSLTTSNQTALLTLPFDSDRDSRHHYKTREEQAVYKNREETRDAFLYELRTFLNLRGKAASQTDKAVARIQSSARAVVDGVKDSNLPWFCEFFCELLLQIGLVPLEETDKDLLKMDKRDKMQKLHRRFSSKTTHASKSTRKLTSDPKSLSVTSPVIEAQQYFPGHQEFFYLFLIHADSYRVGVHLKLRLVHLIRTLSANLSTDKLEKQVMELCMLARFLGFLVFSPNWMSASSEQLRLLCGTQGSCGLVQLEALGLPLVVLVEEASRSRSLVGVIPWIVDLLKLTAWDDVTERSSSFERIVSLLRQIELSTWHAEQASAQSFALIKYSLETLFGEILGISRASQSFVRDDGETDIRDRGLDDAGVLFSSGAFAASNPHFEELASLVSRFARADFSSLRSPGVSRKLRPSVLVASPESTVVDTDTAVSNSALIASSTRLFQQKLQDRFFHQHQELKAACEFVGGRILRRLTSGMAANCVRPFLDTRTEPGATSSTLEEEVVEASRSYLKSNLEVDMRQALSVLLPPNVDLTVVDTAVSLSTSHSLEASESTIRLLVGVEIADYQRRVSTDEQKQLFQVEESVRQTAETGGSLSVVTKDLVGLSECIAMNRDTSLKPLETLLQSTLYRLEALLECGDNGIRPDTELRPFFQAILDLDKDSLTVIDWALASTVDEPPATRWAVLSSFLLLAARLMVLSRHGLRRTIDFVAQEDALVRIIDLGMHAGEISSLSSVLVALASNRLIKTTRLCSVLDQRRRDAPSARLSTLVEQCRQELAASGLPVPDQSVE